MVKTYKTTVGTYKRFGDPFDPTKEMVNVKEPTAPGGDGWILLNTCAADGLIFYTWYQVVESEKSPEITVESN